MKYYSEKLNKFYDSVDECTKAEEEEDLKQSNISKQKKELSKAIEDADNKLKEANKLYHIAQDKAKEILEKSNKEIHDILDVAEENVKKAEEEKLNAIIKFNKEFGSYKVALTNEDAMDAFDRSFERFDKTIKNIFKNFWF